MLDFNQLYKLCKRYNEENRAAYIIQTAWRKHHAERFYYYWRIRHCPALMHRAIARGANIPKNVVEEGRKRMQTHVHSYHRFYQGSY